VNEEQKLAYHERYQKAKQKGVKFFPDIIYKDTLVVFSLFLLLVGLALIVGVANEAKADPNDTSYIPRPEWYFLWLFEMLKYFPGQLEWVGTVIVPGILVLVLFLLPFLDRNPHRYFKKRKIAIAVMTIVVSAIIALTIIAAVTTPPQVESEAIAGTLPEKIAAGEELYAIQCVECHGPDGEGGEIKGVEGLEGVFVKSINSLDEMYTRTDDTLYNIIDLGQGSLGMPPNGKAYGGELGPAEVENIVLFPVLGENEIPSYEVHVAPIVKRYCLSCHRPGKKNNNYLMGTYEETMQSGDNVPNIIAEDLGNNLIRVIHREEIDAGGPMPPTKALPEEYIQIFERWVMGGAPNTADEAAALSPTSPAPGESPVEEPSSTETTAESPSAIPEEMATSTPQPQ